MRSAAEALAQLNAGISQGNELFTRAMQLAEEDVPESGQGAPVRTTTSAAEAVAFGMLEGIRQGSTGQEALAQIRAGQPELYAAATTPAAAPMINVPMRGTPPSATIKAPVGPVRSPATAVSPPNAGINVPDTPKDPAAARREASNDLARFEALTAKIMREDSVSPYEAFERARLLDPVLWTAVAAPYAARSMR